MPNVKMYTSNWCPDCIRAKRFLSDRGVQVEEINVDEDPDAEDIVLKVNHGRRKVPTFEVDGEFFSCSPFDPHILAEKFNLSLNP